MRRILIIVAVLVVVVATGAHFYFAGREFEFRFTEQQLRERLSERLPISKRYFVVFVAGLDNPRVSLEEGSSRVNAGLDVTLNLQLATEAKRHGGTIDVSGGIRYDNEAGQFSLTDPLIHDLAVKAFPRNTRSVPTKS